MSDAVQKTTPRPRVAIERDGDTVTVTLTSLGLYEAIRVYDDLIRQARSMGEIVLTIPTAKASLP